MARLFLGLAAGWGLAGVGMGAFGAHALAGRLSAPALAAYQTGVQYHLLHALALALTAVLAEIWGHRASGIGAAGACFIAGSALFSGSLYALSVLGARALGPVTPVGGLLLMAGWALLGWAALRRPRR